IYDDASGGTKLWTETIPNVPVSHGIFGSKLGAINSLASLSFTQQYWLGITVQGGTEMVPRIELVKSPSALSVAGANNVIPSTGNAGIGTTSPNSKVEVVGAGNTNDTRGLTVRNADGTAALSVLDNGAVGVHEESPDAGLRVTGMGVDSFSRAFHVTDANGT